MHVRMEAEVNLAVVHLVWEAESLIDLKPTKQTRLAGQEALGIRLSLSSQNWDCKCILPGLA